MVLLSKGCGSAGWQIVVGSIFAPLCLAAGCPREGRKYPCLRSVGTGNVPGFEARSCMFISLGPLAEVGSEAELRAHSALGIQGLGNACSSPPGSIGGRYGEADGEELQ